MKKSEKLAVQLYLDINFDLNVENKKIPSPKALYARVRDDIEKIIGNVDIADKNRYLRAYYRELNYLLNQTYYRSDLYLILSEAERSFRDIIGRTLSDYNLSYILREN